MDMAGAWPAGAAALKPGVRRASRQAVEGSTARDPPSTSRPPATGILVGTSQPPEYLEAPYEAMETFLAEVDARYGSMEGYAASIGVPPTSIDALRATLVD